MFSADPQRTFHGPDGLRAIALQQRSATYGPLAGSGPPSKMIWAAAPLPNCSNVRPLSRITFYDSALLATSCIEYLRETT